MKEEIDFIDLTSNRLTEYEKKVNPLISESLSDVFHYQELQNLTEYPV